MTLHRFIKDHIQGVMFIVGLMVIINLVLITSAPLNKSVYDLVYMNILCFAMIILYGWLAYKKWRKTYESLYEALIQNKELYWPTDPNLESEIIRRLMKYQNRELINYSHKYQEALNEVNEYMTKWVHEIKIPISVCELLADELEELEKGVEPIGNKSEELRFEIDRIKYLIQQILYTSRANSYSEDLKIQEVDLEKITKKIIRDNKNLFIRKELHMNVCIHNALVLTDKKWITYIIEQVLHNACKYSPNNSKIDIWSTEKERCIELYIKDQGMGIGESDINRVFDKGFTGENGRKGTKSTGMGLYLANKMMNILSHQIQIKSKENEFTEVCLTFYKLDDFSDVTKMSC